MTPRTRWPWVVAILALVASLVVFHSTLMTLVIEPTAWLLWAAWRIMASANQNVCWTILIVLCAAIILRLVPLGAILHADEADDTHSLSFSTTGNRLAHWKSLVESARGHEGRASLLLMLNEMALHMAHVAKVPPPPSPRDMNSLGSMLARILPGFQSRRDWTEIAGLLDWMEAALEITHGSVDDD